MAGTALPTRRCHTLAILLCFFFVLATQSASVLDVAIDVGTGAYTVTLDGVAWLQSAPTGIHVNGTWYLAAAPSGNGTAYGQLVLVDVCRFTSSDAWGTYAATALDWVAVGGTTTRFSSVFKQYAAPHATLIVFEQDFPDGANGTALGTSYATMDEPMAMFPRFAAAGARLGELGYYTILDQWEMDMVGVGLDGVDGGLYSGTPLLLYDRDTLASLVLSPANHFKAGVQGRPAAFGRDLACGVQGRVQALPRRFRFQTMLYASASGINGAMVEWGDLLLARYGKARYDPGVLDPQRSFLQFNTATGGYYWYATLPGLNYEETMLALKAAHQAAGLPVRVYELDSWWYYKQANGTNSTDMWGGIWRYEPMPDVFPSGMASVQAQLGTPLITHSKYFASTTVYADAYPFLKDPVLNDADAAIPLTPEAYDEVMSMVAAWGVVMIKQDWLESVYEFLEAASSDTTSARNNLVNLAGAVARAGMTLQLCMPLVGDILQSVECPGARSIRISDDYGDPTQWRIGQNSIYAWALGLAPFKDVFWTENAMPGNPYGDYTEPNPELQAAVSALSTAGVGFGDGIGYTNATLLMRTCAADGTLLGPAKPATVIDAWFRRTGGPSGGEVWHTYTQLPVVGGTTQEAGGGVMVVHYVFAVNLTAPFAFQTHDAYLDPRLGRSTASDPFTYWAYDVGTGPSSLARLTATTPLVVPACPAATDGSGVIPYYLYAAAQQLENGWTLLGESGKFVPASSQRFGAVTITVDANANGVAMAVAVHGAVGERVTVHFVAPDGTSVAAACQFPGVPPAWWGNQTTSLDQQLIAYCTAVKVCACSAAMPVQDQADAPANLAPWALVLIGAAGAILALGILIGSVVAWRRWRGAATGPARAGTSEAAPLLPAQS